MIRIVACLALLSALAACGVDGEPERPEPRPTAGVTITGAVEVGLSG